VRERAPLLTTCARSLTVAALYGRAGCISGSFPYFFRIQAAMSDMTASETCWGFW
jgi:hypothetical protein